MYRVFLLLITVNSSVLLASCGNSVITPNLGYKQKDTRKSSVNSKNYMFSTVSVKTTNSIKQERKQKLARQYYKDKRKYSRSIGPILNRFSALKSINSYRKQKGLRPLKINEKLMKAARQHSLDMSRQDALSHIGSDGTDPWDRAMKNNYFPEMTAENVGAGQEKFGNLLHDWKNSALHNANLMLPDAEEIGLALVHDNTTRRKTFWTLILAKKK